MEYRWDGRHGQGAMRLRRTVKREEAEHRQLESAMRRAGMLPALVCEPNCGLVTDHGKCVPML